MVVSTRRLFGHREGFILPMSVLLVVMLTVSGAGFLQFDYLERRMAGIETDNHGAFYLANAGIERARELLRIETAGVPVWTSVFSTYPDDTDRTDNPLCPTDPTWRCVILPFGAIVGPPGIPFAGTFDDGTYEVRAFNDGGPTETGTVDNNGLLIVRARGMRRGEQKLLEIIATSTRFGLLNCENDDTDAPCPDTPEPNKQQPTLLHLQGRDPQSIPSFAFPVVDYSYYSDPSNFGLAACGPYTGGVPTSGCLYLNDGPIDITSGADNVVFFAAGDIVASGNITLTNTILVSQGAIDLQGNVVLQAPTSQNFPAAIAGTTLKGDSAVVVTGNVYAQSIGESSQQPLNPINFHGLIYGGDIFLKSGTTVNDDGNLAYYGLMPGFTYDDASTTAGIARGSWRERQ